MRKLLVFVLVLVLPVASGGMPVDVSIAQGSSHYVDNAATGSNDGTSWADAWQSFSDIDWGSVHPEDTIYISGGSGSKTYGETLTIGASGVDGGPISIRPGAAHPTQSSGHDGWVVISSGVARGIDYGSYDYVTVDGSDGAGNRRIRVTNTTGDGVYASGSTGIRLLYVHVYRCGDSANDDGIQFTSCLGGSEIAYCDVEDPWQDGIKVSGHYTPVDYGSMIVHHNHVHGMVDDGIAGDGSLDVYDNVIGPWGDWSSATGHPDGMQIYAGYLRIYNNTFFTDHWPNGSNALLFLNHAFGWNHQMDHVIVYNNLFMAAGESYSGAYFRGVFVEATGGEGNEDMDDVVIVNNTFVDVGHVAISVSARDAGARFTNFVIKNNVVYNCKQYGGSGVVSFGGFDFDNSDVDFDYNVVNVGISGRGGVGWNGETYTISEFNALFGTSNISIAPTFVGYSPGDGLSNDLHLSPADTAARDSGADLSAYIDDDKDGISRPYGAGWDIGAYEFIPDLALHGRPASQAIHLDWTVNVTPPVTSTWRITFYSETVPSPVVRTGIVSPTRAYTLTGLTNYEWYTVTLNAMVDAAPILTDTVRVMPTDIFVHLPIVIRED